MREFGRDALYTVRRWRRRPGFAVAASATLALGIAATTTLFTLIDGVLLTRLPWAHADRLVAVYAVRPDLPASTVGPSHVPPELQRIRRSLSRAEWRALQTSPAFETVAVWQRLAREAVEIDRGLDMADVMSISAELLPMLGVRMTLGRSFTPQEDESGGVVILSHSAWLHRFGGRPDVVGDTIRIGTGLSRRPYVVIGVTAPGFPSPDRPADLLVPATSLFMTVAARLAPGVSHEAATDAVTNVVRASASSNTAGRVLPYAQDVVEARAPALWLAFGAALLLWAIACANVGGLAASDGRARQRELAVQHALGATRGRLVRQLLAEYGLIAAGALAGGLGLAAWGVPLVVAYAPADLPRLTDVALSLRGVGIAVASGLLAFVVFGPVLAWVQARAALRTAVAGSTQATVGQRRFQSVVVASQVAVTYLLIVGAALLGETLFRLSAVPLGFDPSKLVVAHLRDLTEGREHPPGEIRDDVLVTRLRAIPGVRDVALASSVPFFGFAGGGSVDVSGHAPSSSTVSHYVVSPNYLHVMGVPLLKGRGFEAGDGPATRVAVVSESFERQRMDGDGIGRQVRLSGSADGAEVIGVVPDAALFSRRSDYRPAFYTLADRRNPDSYVIVRTTDVPSALMPAIRHTLQARLDERPGDHMMLALSPMETVVATDVREERFRAWLAGAFSGAAVLLAAVGIYGLIARRVIDQRREIGVRMALGATRGQVRRLVARVAAANVLLGLSVGLPTAVVASQAMPTLLYGVVPTAPHVFLFAAVVLAGTAGLATLAPARAATRIDPARVIKD